jgi:hypothetical protein
LRDRAQTRNFTVAGLRESRSRESMRQEQNVSYAL